MIYLKTAEEIELLRENNLLVSATLAEVGKHVRPGVSTLELDKLAEEFIRSHGAEPGFLGYGGFPNTLCMSVNEEVVHGIPSAKRILKPLGLRKGGIEVVSCPTCGRTQIDLIGLANQVERMVEDIPLNDIKVAVMGCVVNGPGEAKEADIGIAGGKGTGMLIKKGEIVQRMPESELLGALREELLHWNEN